MADDNIRSIPLNEFDEWVAHIATGLPNPPPGAIVFFGFLNDADPFDTVGTPTDRAAKRTRYRLYLTIHLDEYLVIEKKDILHNEDLQEGFYSPMGGNLLWVKPDAEIEHVRVQHYEAQSSFLRGPITSTYSQAAQLGQTMGGGPGGVSLACPGGGVSLACPGGGVSLACPGGGVSLACPGGGVSLACPGGGVSLVNCR